MTIKYIAEHLPYTLSHILSRHIQWKGYVCLPLFQTNKQVSFVSCLNVPRLLHLLTPPSLLSCLPNLWYWNVLATRLRKIPPIHHNLPSTTGSQSQPQSCRFANLASAQAWNFKDLLPQAKISPYLL